jgi:segregation and condensation protein B
LAVEFASANRGVTLEEVGGGYRLHTKVDNMNYLKRMVKARPFRLSGPAMEVMSIVAYKQPVVKVEIDEIRGVESGHLLRALMEKGLVNFAGKSELPGKPMLYETTRKFLETFSLKSIKELPALSEIDELLPEGMDVEEQQGPTLDVLTGDLSTATTSTYSDGESELFKITDELAQIDTSSEFFEQEKIRQRQLRDENRAKDLEEAIWVGEAVADADRRWLERYRAKQIVAPVAEVTESTESTETTAQAETAELAGDAAVPNVSSASNPSADGSRLETEAVRPTEL